MDEKHIPNVERCYISEEKITMYLLNRSHPDGQSKAQFFFSFGFSREKWHVLQIALENHARNNSISKIEETLFGVKYIVDGLLQTPDNRNPHIRTIWFIDSHDENSIPHLVTAYPVKEIDTYD